MTLRFSPRAAAFLGLAALALLPAAAQAAPTYAYTLKDLGVLTGGTNSVGYGVNDSGQVTGYSNLSSGLDHAFLYSNGTLNDLGTLGNYGSSFGNSINSSGQVTGFSDVQGGGTTGFFYNGSSLQGLNAGFSVGNGINSSGQIAGTYYPVGTYSHAFVTDANGSGLTDLHTLGGSDSEGLGVNDFGQVTGYSYTANNNHRDAFLTIGNTLGQTMIDIGGVNGGGYSEGLGVNNLGQVTGDYNDSGFQHAFLTSADGANLAGLGTLGGDSSEGRSVNSSGQVVGNSEITPGGGAQHAFLYTGGTMTDLNSLIDPTLGFTLNYAYGISNNGYITGVGVINNQSHAFLLKLTADSGGTVAPEPAAIVPFALMGMGLAGMILKARKKKSA